MTVGLAIPVIAVAVWSGISARIVMLVWSPAAAGFHGPSSSQAPTAWRRKPASDECARLDRMSRAQLDKRPGEVAAMFDGLADRYDLLNDVLSLGADRLWRRVVARAVAARAGETILDLAAGTGTSSRTFTTAGARCIACDFSLGMLRAGHARPAQAVSFVCGDATRLPFCQESFDAATISFGLRNVTDPDRALAEMLRVTRPGGRLVVCEFGHLAARPLDRAYESYLAAVLPRVARLLSRNPAAYDYLAESIAAWPAQPELARQIQAAGWSGVRWRNLSLGIVALHLARRPASGPAASGPPTRSP
jgi:demethylmenaquinone methyltransferase/2-methoxy-6-polyprenyl-1,4-benzoquinol methylase